jgi:hypothetical protein
MSLRLGTDPNIRTVADIPLYSVANECASEAGPEESELVEPVRT